MDKDKDIAVEGGVLEKRILVATNTVETTAFTLGIAANVALMLQARLETLFVEDIGLLRLAALPFATELSSVSGIQRALNLPDVSIALQEQVKFLRRAMQEVVEEKNLRTGLSVRRGDYLTEAFLAESEVLFITPPKQILKVDYPPTRRHHSSPSFAPRSLPVYVYLQTGSLTRNATVIAKKLASILGGDLVFLIPENRMGLVGEIKKLLDNSELGMPTIRFELAETGLLQAAAGVARKGCALFISSRKAFSEQENQVLPSDVSCPMMFLS